MLYSERDREISMTSVKLTTRYSSDTLIVYSMETTIEDHSRRLLPHHNPKPFNQFNPNNDYEPSNY